MMLEATDLAAYRISRANPSSDRIEIRNSADGLRSLGTEPILNPQTVIGLGDTQAEDSIGGLNI